MQWPVPYPWYCSVHLAIYQNVPDSLQEYKQWVYSMASWWVKDIRIIELQKQSKCKFDCVWKQSWWRENSKAGHHMCCHLLLNGRYGGNRFCKFEVLIWRELSVSVTNRSMDQANEKLPKSDAVVLLYFIQSFQNIASGDLLGVSWMTIFPGHLTALIYWNPHLTSWPYDLLTKIKQKMRSPWNWL